MRKVTKRNGNTRCLSIWDNCSGMDLPACIITRLLECIAPTRNEHVPLAKYVRVN
jgi:hypothetical protein